MFDFSLPFGLNMRDLSKEEKEIVWAVYLSNLRSLSLYTEMMEEFFDKMGRWDDSLCDEEFL